MSGFVNGHSYLRDRDPMRILFCILWLLMQTPEVSAALVTSATDARQVFASAHLLPEQNNINRAELVRDYPAAPARLPDTSAKRTIMSSITAMVLAILFTGMAGLVVVIVKLRRQRHELHTLYESIPIGIVKFNAIPQMIYANRAARQMMDIRPDEVPGTWPPVKRGKVVHEDGSPMALNQRPLNIYHRTGQVLMDSVLGIVNERGETKWLLINIVPEIGGRGIGVGTFNDITSQKDMEEQLRQSQKMEALGHLVGGVAHDFNNGLSIIQGHLELLQSNIEKEGLGRDWINEPISQALIGTERCAQLTNRLLKFSRDQPSRTHYLIVDELLRDMETIVSRVFDQHVEVIFDLTAGKSTVQMEPADFENAIINMAINARDAMPNGGRFSIDTQVKTLESSPMSTSENVPPGEYIVLSVNDNGIGMSNEIRQRVFEPFFTTKEPGKGTGLGMSLIYSFIQRTGGHIRVYSAFEQGTTFRLFLPHVTPAVSPDTTRKESSTIPCGAGQTILVVDDEKELVSIACASLGQLGYRTLKANNAESAVNVLKKHPEVKLLFSDIVMPGKLNGVELVQYAQQHYPSLKYLLTTGFSTTIAYSKSGDLLNSIHADGNLVYKPYGIGELARAVANCLDDVGSEVVTGK